MTRRPRAELSALRDRIAALERAGRPRTGVLPFGVAPLDAVLPGGGLALGALHEVAGGGEGAVDGAAAALFAAGIAARLSGPVLWCVTRPDLFAPALFQAGLPPHRVLYVEAGDDRRILQDVVTCIRNGCTIDDLGFRRQRSADRYLKRPEEMHRLFPRHSEALARTVALADRCRFSLDELAYQYPDEVSTPGMTPQQTLEQLTWEGARDRYPEGVPDRVRRALTHELGLIGALGYAPYFLTVNSIVRFARGQDILCQGRGSAANSAVCYVLGVTAIDPDRHDLLFERFVSQLRARCRDQLRERQPPARPGAAERNARLSGARLPAPRHARVRRGMTYVLDEHCARPHRGSCA